MRNTDFELVLPDGGRTRHAGIGAGRTLLEAMQSAGIPLGAPCGGNRRCGQCKVRVEGEVSPMGEKERSFLTGEEVAAGTRLACFCEIAGPFTVYAAAAGSAKIQSDGRLGAVTLNPGIKVHYITLEQAGIDNQVSFFENVRSALAGGGVKVSAAANSAFAGLRDEGGACFACVGGGRLLLAGSSNVRIAGCAVDIGTTTVVAYLYDLATGERLAATSQLSAQRAYGADVISRIQSAAAGTLSAQRDAVTGQLDDMVGLLCAKCGIDRRQLLSMTICGNTVMQHLLCGIDPSSIAAAPFIPASCFGYSLPAPALGIDINDGAEIFLLPCVSGYIGGDVTAGVFATEMTEAQKPCLLLDIGTNGEIALGCGAEIYYCSTAAGPAFEGAHIADGVGGIEGAMSRVFLDDEGNIGFETIGGLPAVGICGSGIIDAMAVLLAIGAVDETGRLVDEDEMDLRYAGRLVEEDGCRKFIICPDSQIGLTDADIRQIQLAKAAIAAGIQVLVGRAKIGGRAIGFDDIDKVYLAGGFGTHLSTESGSRIGLIPPQLKEKVVSVGNSAGMGAVKALLDAGARVQLEGIRAAGSYIELSSDAEFNDAYIENMMFE